MQLIRLGLLSIAAKRFFNLANHCFGNIRVSKYVYKKYEIGALLLSWSWLFRSPPTEEEKIAERRRKLISEADAMFKQNKHRELCNLLVAHKGSNDVELLWRLARAKYSLSQELATSPEEKRLLIFKGAKIMTRSLSINSDHFENHKWMSILLDARSGYEGITTRILHLENIKMHMLRAIELNPKDATTLYMLGMWCYQICSMPWYLRKMASIVFSAPPISSYEESLQYFLKAEEAEPRFYSRNLLMIGKTYLKLGQEDKARDYLHRVYTYHIVRDHDRLARQEAYEILRKLNEQKRNIHKK